MLSVTSLLIYAQSPLRFTHIDERQGLDAREFVSFYTDNRGLLWIGAAEGLFTFDGHGCTNRSIFKKSDSTNYHIEHVSNIVEDKEGNLIMGVTDGTVSYDRATDRMKYRPLYFNKEHDGRHYSHPFYIDDRNKLWVFICDESSLSSIDLSSPVLKRDTILDLGNGFYTAANNRKYEPLKQVAGNLVHGFVYATISQDGKVNHVAKLLDKEVNGKPSQITVNSFFFFNDSILYIAANMGLVKYNLITNDFRIYTSYEGKKITKLSCMQGHEDLLYIGTREDGLLIFDPKKEEYIQQIVHDVSNRFSLSGNYVQHLYIDPNHNLFVGIYGVGMDICNLHLQRISSAYTDNLPEQKKQAISFTAFSPFIDGSILAGTTSLGLVQLDLNKKITKIWDQKNSAIPSNHITSLYAMSLFSSLVGTNNGIVYMDNKSGNITLVTPYSSASAFYTNRNINYIDRISDKEVGFCTEGGFFVVDDRRRGFQSIDTLNQELYTRYQSFYPVSPDEIIVNTDFSYLLKVKRENGKWRIIKKAENYASVYGYCRLNSNQLLMATSKGLQKLEINQFIVSKIELPIDAQCFSIAQVDSTIWMGSDKGLISYRLDNREFHLIDERQNAINKGYNPSALLNAGNGEIFIGGRNGLNFFDPGSIVYDKQAPQPLLSGLLINDAVYAFDSNINECRSLTFPFAKNTLTFQFSTISFIFPEVSTLTYYLEGYDKNPVTVSGRGNVRYARLPPGDYIFHLRSNTPDKSGTGIDKVIAIHITPPFYQRWWFRLLAILFITAIIYAVFNYRINKVRKEEAQKTIYNKQLAEMESRALRSQMNPHFIFNSLNSIQRYIFQNDVEKSSNYLTRFARLMRQILENSKHQLILLSEELNSLDTYIELEKMRFDNKFTYHLEISDDVEQEHILVPPLFLQPYVENAIWHGLMHKDESGELRIDISQSESGLTIVIQDNGIGRKAASLLKTKLPNNHKSTALKATEERLMLVERTLGQKVNVKFVDLEGQDGSPLGTKVEITMPLINENN